MWSLITGHCPPTVDTCWLLKESPPFSVSVVLTNVVVVVGHKRTNMAIHSGQQVNSFTKQLTTRWTSCQLKGQRAFEMAPLFDRNTDLSRSHAMLEHWHCSCGQPWPQLIVLMRQSHTGSDFSSVRISACTLNNTYFLISCWGASCRFGLSSNRLSLTTVVRLRLNDNMLKIGSQRHRG